MRIPVALFLVLAVGCSSEDQPPVPPEVAGTITATSRDDQGEIEAITVEAESGTYDILIDPQHDYGFDLEHLEEHRSTGDPVLVVVEQREDGAYATRIDDA